jgi:5-methylcytosine-specific restriction endonuclease McrA
MEKISLEEAKRQDRKRYFTGEPCPQGHFAERSVHNRGCLECARNDAAQRHAKKMEDPKYVQAARDRAAKWAVENPIRYQTRQQEWRKQNHDYAQKYNAKYREESQEQIAARRAAAYSPEINSQRHKKYYANPDYAEKTKERARKWGKANPEKKEKVRKAWNAKNPERHKEHRQTSTVNRRARKKNGGKISVKTYRELRAITTCAACGVDHGIMEIDHIVALSRGGTNQRTNLQILCRRCNRDKGTKDPIKWAAERTQATTNPFAA